MLDEVIWIVRTNRTEDVAWLDVLLSTESDYKKWDVKFNETGDYRSAYDRVENGTMYIKIDDDIVILPSRILFMTANTGRYSWKTAPSQALRTQRSPTPSGSSCPPTS
jgi:hypothetical protein